jgi:hypothetical protein
LDSGPAESTAMPLAASQIATLRFVASLFVDDFQIRICN